MKTQTTIPETAIHLSKLTARLENNWPSHNAFISRNFGARTAEEIDFLDDIARRVLILNNKNVDAAVENYKDVCSQYIKLEIEFRKRKRYFNLRFDEVVSELYDKSVEMNSYMTGLLMSVVFYWQNSGPYYHYLNNYLPKFYREFELIEVGPGHGLGTLLALEHPNCARVTGLDISSESIAMTEKCLSQFGLGDRFTGYKGDICECPPEITADGAVISQVLEVVSDPKAALANIHAALRDNGILFVNAPVNFAAPDHIRRWHNSEQIDEILLDVGFEIHERQHFLPSTIGDATGKGYSYVVVCAKS